MESSAVETLFKTVTTVITNITNTLSTVSTSLLSNSIFELMMGIVVFFIVMGIVFRLVSKLRKGGR